MSLNLKFCYNLSKDVHFKSEPDFAAGLYTLIALFVESFVVVR